MELLIVLGIVLLLFGGAKLPKLARSMGEASKEFRAGMKDGENDADKAAPKADDSTDEAKPEVKAESNGSAAKDDAPTPSA